jgi:hypothetical protein
MLPSGLGVACARAPRGVTGARCTALSRANRTTTVRHHGPASPSTTIRPRGIRPQHTVPLRPHRPARAAACAPPGRRGARRPAGPARHFPRGAPSFPRCHPPFETGLSRLLCESSLRPCFKTFKGGAAPGRPLSARLRSAPAAGARARACAAPLRRVRRVRVRLAHTGQCGRSRLGASCARASARAGVGLRLFARVVLQLNASESSCPTRAKCAGAKAPALNLTNFS